MEKISREQSEHFKMPLLFSLFKEVTVEAKLYVNVVGKSYEGVKIMIMELFFRNR